MISKKLEIVFNEAIKKVNEKKYEFLTLENILLALLENDQDVRTILEACGANLYELEKDLKDFIDQSENFSVLTAEDVEELSREQFPTEELRELAQANGIAYQPEMTLAVQRVIQRAALHVQAAEKHEITGGNILVAMFDEKEGHAVYFLQKQNVERLDVVSAISHGMDKANNYQIGSDISEDELDSNSRKKQYDSALGDFTIDLTQKAREGKLDPMIGREMEMQRIVQILCRRQKNNPLLVGDSGVGKTTIAEGLAQAIVAGKVPPILHGIDVFSLDMASLMAGTKYRGDFEQRFKSVIKAVAKHGEGKNILFIDEIHTIVGAGSTGGGSMDASNLLKPVLSLGEIRCMGSSTYEECRKFFDKDHALNRRFQKVEILEPNKEDSLKILQGIKHKFEEHHGVKYQSSALKAAVDLSDKHISDKKLPDKAIDVIDEVGAISQLSRGSKRKTTITVKDIENVVAIIARIPKNSVTVSEKDKLKNIERDLKLVIFGQDEAISRVVASIHLSRSGLGHSDKPIASYLFMGPTGVGKTELAKQLAHLMGIYFERFDMSEYMEKHSVAKLIGAPPGYVGFDSGGLLTESINKHPHAVLLLDEIEKAHSDVYNILLQIMDSGVLTDSNGRKTDFRNIILIMTSNVGAREMESGAIGLVNSDVASANSSISIKALKNTFSPEFRNRLDAVVNFNKLSQKSIDMVVDKFLIEIEEQLLSKKIHMNVTADVKGWLASTGYDSQLGARPIYRLINEKIRKVLANEILFGKLSGGGNVEIYLKDDKIEFSFL